MKKYIAMFLVVVLSFSLCACNGNTLNGTYMSESGTYSVEFKKDGTCTWYQNGAFFNGTYQSIDNGWQLNIHGNGWYGNTVFIAEGTSQHFVITGGVIESEMFNKQ